jgi:hypothetical protein
LDVEARIDSALLRSIPTLYDTIDGLRDDLSALQTAKVKEELHREKTHLEKLRWNKEWHLFAFRDH